MAFFRKRALPAGNAAIPHRSPPILPAKREQSSPENSSGTGIRFLKRRNKNDRPEGIPRAVVFRVYACKSMADTGQPSRALSASRTASAGTMPPWARPSSPMEKTAGQVPAHRPQPMQVSFTVAFISLPPNAVSRSLSGALRAHSLSPVCPVIHLSFPAGRRIIKITPLAGFRLRFRIFRRDFHDRACSGLF